MRSSTRDNIALVVGVVVAILVVRTMDNRGMPQKWHAAVIGTIVPFAVVLLAFRRWWTLYSFWVSLSICFAVHLGAIWIFFQYVLRNISGFGTILWYPIAIVEIFVVLVVVQKLQQMLTGRHEPIKPS